MAVLLHVQGSGRDPLRPFGGHAIRTVAWERFDPGSVGRDVDTIVISPPDPLTGVDAVAAIRDAGDSHPVLLVPDDSPGWRQVAASPLPNADVVLGGIRSLPDYLPSADYPLESGQWPDLEGSEDTREAARVIDLRLRIPRGGSHRMLRQRLGDQPHDIASAVQQFTADLTADRRVESTPEEVLGSDGGESTADPFEWPVPALRRATREEAGPSAFTRPTRAAHPADPAGPGRSDTPAVTGPPAQPGAPVVSRSLLHSVTDAGAPGDGDPPGDAAGGTRDGSSPGRVSRRLPHLVVQPPHRAPVDAVDAVPSRRLARGINDPAVLVPALLGCAEKLDSPGNVAGALAELARTTMPADAVDVLLPDSGTWHTVATAGTATGAGGVGEVVDVAGLVTWLESFDSPVVLDGSDLAAPGSWVLAGLVRPSRQALAVILCWREPGQPVFDPAGLTALADLAGDATSSLHLALQVRDLARALSVFAD